MVSLRDSAVTGLGGRVRVEGVDRRFDPLDPNYPRSAVEVFERRLDGRVIFVRNLNAKASLMLLTDQNMMLAKVAGTLDVISHTQFLSIELRNIGSVFLSSSFIQAQHRQDRLVALAVALVTPVAIIREFQRKPGVAEDHLDGWSVVRLDDDVVRAYLDAARACPTGGPTRFEVFEIGAPNLLLRRELASWRGESACYFDDPCVNVQRNQIALVTLV